MLCFFFTGLAGGFWGNHVLHNGVVEFEIATQNIVGIVRHIQEMSRKYNEVLQKDIEQNMNKLYDGPFQRDIRESPSSHLEIMDNSDFIFFNISEGLKAMDEIRFTVSDPNNRIDLRYLPFWASTVERYRWPITMALQSKIPTYFSYYKYIHVYVLFFKVDFTEKLSTISRNFPLLEINFTKFFSYFKKQVLFLFSGIFTLFCLLLFVGAIIHSRCVLILFSVCGLFSIIFLWLLASVYTTAAVALADFCFDPTPWVKHILKVSVKDIIIGISNFFVKLNFGKF